MQTGDRLPKKSSTTCRPNYKHRICGIKVLKAMNDGACWQDIAKQIEEVHNSHIVEDEIVYDHGTTIPLLTSACFIDGTSYVLHSSKKAVSDN